jgi:membrane protein YqaA with SNARE-associated domain
MAAGSGSALGELSGYLAGFSGRTVVTRTKWNDRLQGWMHRYGDMTVLVMAIIPNPAFDVAGILAGAMKMPLWRFVLWCWLGKTIKMLFFAYGGDAIFNIIPK